jgi:S1-C subfamily serine protease
MKNLLTDFSRELTEVLGRAAPFVVRVDARRGAPASGIVWSDGVVLATSHSIEEEDGIEVTTHDGRRLVATLAGRDPTTDIAALRVAAVGVPPAFADGDGWQVGQLVLSLGRPAAGVRAGVGIVSAVGGAWRTDAGGRIDRYAQLDLGLYPGFSGSLLCDAEGRALAMGTAGLRRGAALALPAATLRRVAEALLTRGRVRRAYLGIGSQPVALPAAWRENAGQETGLLVASVQPGSAADQAGLLLGDVVIALHAAPVRNLGDLFALLDEERIGVPSTVRVLRAGETRDLSITLGARGER